MQEGSGSMVMLGGSRLLELYLQENRIQPGLSAAQQTKLLLLLVPYVARKVEDVPQLAARHAAAAWAASRRACALLLRAEPGNATLLLVQTCTVAKDDPTAEGLAAYRAALAAAEASNAQYLAVQAAVSAVSELVRGAGGPAFEAAEAERMLGAAKRGQRLSRRWLWTTDPLKSSYEALRAELDEMKARQRGAAPPAL